MELYRDLNQLDYSHELGAWKTKSVKCLVIGRNVSLLMFTSWFYLLFDTIDNLM